METLSKRTVLPSLDWRPACPVGMEKAVVPETTWVPLTESFKVTGPVPVTSNFTVFQALALITALPLATLWKVAVPLSQ